MWMYFEKTPNFRRKLRTLKVERKLKGYSLETLETFEKNVTVAKKKSEGGPLSLCMLLLENEEIKAGTLCTNSYAFPRDSFS